MSGDFLMEKVRDIEKALKAEAYLSALALALMLPDVCGKIEFKSDTNSSRYMKWYRKYLPSLEGSSEISQQTNDDSVIFGAENCYKLRCAFLHEGISEKWDYKDSMITFKLTKDSYIHAGNFYFGPVRPNHEVRKEDLKSRSVLLSIPQFCQEMCKAVRSFYESHKELFEREDTPVCIIYQTDTDAFESMTSEI